MFRYPEEELVDLTTSHWSPTTSAHTAPRSRHAPEEDELQGLTTPISSKRLLHSLLQASSEVMERPHPLQLEATEGLRGSMRGKRSGGHTRPESPPREHRYRRYSPDRHCARTSRLPARAFIIALHRVDVTPRVSPATPIIVSALQEVWKHQDSS